MVAWSEVDTRLQLVTLHIRVYGTPQLDVPERLRLRHLYPRGHEALVFIDNIVHDPLKLHVTWLRTTRG